MAKKKNTKALFEMLGGENGSGAKIGVPDWIKNPKPRPDAESDAPAAKELRKEPAEESQPVAEKDVTSAEAAASPAAAPKAQPKVEPKVEKPRPRRVLKAETAKPRPAGESVADRMKAKANRLKSQVPPLKEVKPAWIWGGAGGVLVLFVLVLLLISGGSDESTSGTGAGADDPQKQNVIDPPAADEGKLAVGGERSADRKYLIIEVLSGNTDPDRQDAEQVRAYCESHDVPAQVVTLGKRFAIWSLMGFQDSDSPAAKAYAENVYRIGSGYFNQYGKYAFQPKTKTGRPFFVPGPKK